MRSVLITGTSTGFGLVIAVELATAAWPVFATMRNPDKQGPLKEALEAAGVAEGPRSSDHELRTPMSPTRVAAGP